MEHFNLIIKNATICTMDADMRVIQNGYVAVKGSDIATIAEGQVPGGITADKIVDASGQVLFRVSSTRTPTSSNHSSRVWVPITDSSNGLTVPLFPTVP